MKSSLFGSILVLLIAVTSIIGCKTSPPKPRVAVTGTLNYANFSVSPGCTVEVNLNDVSPANAQTNIIAREFVSPRETAPLPFELHYEPSTILPDHRYLVIARISCGGQVLFITDPAVPVITQGNPTFVNITLKKFAP